MIRREAAVIWPSYFSKNLSRKQGRRVSLSLAVRNPSGETLVEAAESLSMTAQLEEGAHPSTWWRGTGKVLVTTRKKTTKNALITAIAITAIARKLLEKEEMRLREHAKEKRKRSRRR